MTRIRYDLRNVGALTPRWRVRLWKGGALAVRTTCYFTSETAALAWVASQGAST
jgi:hypothetical protein